MNMVKKISILFIILSIFISPSCYAQNHYEAVEIGKIEVAEQVFIYGQNSYTLFKVKGQLYLPISSLKSMGLYFNEKDGIIFIDNSLNESNTEESSTVPLADETAVMNSLPVYCGNVRSFTLRARNEVLIPLEALNAFWQIKSKNGVCWSEDSFLNNEMNLLKIDEEGIENKTDHLMSVQYTHLYWNGSNYETTNENLILEANEKNVWVLDTDKLYITTIINKINELPVYKENDNAYGQYHMETFLQYSESIRFREVNELFPPCIILAQMKYKVGPFNEKEVIELCRSENSAYFLVKGQQGQKYKIPFSSAHILGEKGARLRKINDKDIEDFIRLSNIQSPTDYLLWTDLYRQRTYVLKKQDENWKLQKKFICSTGKVNNPTPSGTYQVQYMIPYIGMNKGYRCKYALVFFRDYMYHSILFDKSGKYIKSGQYELGSKASHGCIRLSEKDSEWLYKNIPVNSTVLIR